MRGFLLLVLVACVLVVPSAFGGSQPDKGQVRSPTGKLLYKTKTNGSKTEVRDPTGKLLLKSKTLPGGTTETRSPTGKLLYKAK